MTNRNKSYQPGDNVHTDEFGLCVIKDRYVSPTSQEVVYEVAPLDALENTWFLTGASFYAE